MINTIEKNNKTNDFQMKNDRYFLLLEIFIKFEEKKNRLFSKCLNKVIINKLIYLLWFFSSFE